MELHQIEAYLDSPNSQERIKAITAKMAQRARNV